MLFAYAGAYSIKNFQYKTLFFCFSVARCIGCPGCNGGLTILRKMTKFLKIKQSIDSFQTKNKLKCDHLKKTNGGSRGEVVHQSHLLVL